ncbi:hypothetical protein CU669_15595 [Paramagnetospirillum kuznetsovii]|uniref:Hemerythrin-like domain-containing protein n=1 Tax=Paramagnetospirillum kuznetsovii TaxID=2053833 RepID=A0A364NVR6_9PROT|nr:hypothetical protein [Paramagnetospirillum kuznetsovii]RAU21007.1 hypothetical protein CU669_15595 [Paramagnetospirillum kuznetsovii]
MPGLNWVPSMSVGIDEFDDAHQRFISILKEIADALAFGNPDLARNRCVALLALAQEHGRRELALLTRLNFPRIEIIAETQTATQDNISALLDTIVRAPAEALGMIEGMQRAVVTYLLHGDINFKSFIEELKNQGIWIDPEVSDKE